MLLLLLLLLASTATAAEPPLQQLQLPAAWDIRSAYPRCRAWRVFNQNAHGCAQCCPMALAAALGARECINSGRDSRFSAQQIWDCGAAGIADCQDGVYLNIMLRRMGSGSNAPYTLLPESCAAELGVAPNATRCLNAMLGCAPAPGEGLFLLNARTQALMSYDTLVFRGPRDYAARNAMHSMMLELLTHGPVVSVMTLIGADIAQFSDWSGGEGQVFVPQSLAQTPTLQQATQRHCLMVYGWGSAVTAAGQRPYWLVQNSYGAAWGDRGVARIIRGADVLEGAWRAVSTLPRECRQDGRGDGTVDEPCLPAPYGGYAAAAAAVLFPSPMMRASTTATTTPSPHAGAASAAEEEGLPPPIGNFAIIAIAFACAVAVTFLAVLVLRPSAPSAALPF